MGFELVGRVWDVSGFRSYVASQGLGWAKGVTLHHTAAPSLAQRPAGFKVQHLKNLQSYYQRELGWSSGPHLFIDDDQIWGMSSLARRGVHARSFNSTHIGIEILGNYDRESPTSGRGKACWSTATAATAILLGRMGRTSNSVNFHRDDPRTSKSCPGKLVNKTNVLRAIDRLMKGDDRSGSDSPPARDDLEAVADAIEWQAAKLRRGGADVPRIREAIEWQLHKL